jgi:hypothetical protein
MFRDDDISLAIVQAGNDLIRSTMCWFETVAVGT